MGKEKITHKELLTFSNLTNLEWEFVDLDAIKEGLSADRVQKQKSSGDQSTQLKDLLKPELFVREDEEGNFDGYVYMENVKDRNDISAQDKEEGIIKLRQKAGIAMEYLEKWQEYDYTEGKRGTDEGSFLQDWEVIYAADNYKVIADHLDYIYDEIKKRGVVLVDKDGEELELYPKVETVKFCDL